MDFYDPSTLQGYAQAAATQYGVPYNLFSSMIGAESGWNPAAVNSSSGALGLGQVLPSTAANPGYGISPLTNPLDPQSNLNFAAQYLQTLYQKTGSWLGAVQSYSGSGSALPYAGNSQQGAVLASAFGADQGGASGNTTGASGGSPTGQSWYDYFFNPQQPPVGSTDPYSGSYVDPQGGPTQATVNAATPAWVPKILGDVGAWLQQGSIVLLGLLVIIVGLYLLGKK